MPNVFRRTLLVLAFAATLATPVAALDTTSAAGQFDAFMRMRGNSDGRDVFANWWVTLFAVVPGERPRPILRMDGFNVGRFIKAEDAHCAPCSPQLAN